MDDRFGTHGARLSRIVNDTDRLRQELADSFGDPVSRIMVYGEDHDSHHDRRQ